MCFWQQCVSLREIELMTLPIYVGLASALFDVWLAVVQRFDLCVFFNIFHLLCRFALSHSFSAGTLPSLQCFVVQLLCDRISISQMVVVLVVRSRVHE
jgi:hypothetical protein